MSKTEETSKKRRRSGLRVQWGGSWNYVQEIAQSALHQAVDVRRSRHNLGFRLVEVLDE